MAGVFADNFGWYTSAQILRYYGAFGLTGTSDTGPYGRSGGPGLRFSGAFGDYLETLDLATAGATAIAQWDFRFDADPPQTNVIAAFLDGTTHQVTLDVNTNRTLSVYRGFAGSKTLIAGPSTYAIPLNTDVHVGIKAVIANSGGTVLVHVWESGDTAAQVVISATGLDTQDSGSATWTRFRPGAACNGNTYWSHLVAMDGAGAANTDLLGPCDVFAQRPIADGAHSDFTLSTGVTEYGPVRDLTANDDLTYIEAESLSERVAVTVEPTPYPDRGVAFSVLVHTSRAVGAGIAQLAPLARQAGGDTVGSAETMDTDYAAYATAYNAAPDATPWTAVIWNAMQWGLES